MKNHHLGIKVTNILVAFGFVFSMGMANLFRADRHVIAASESRATQETQAEEYPSPVVAILESEYTQALEPAENWYPWWHYFVLHDSLEEVLRSDGTPFVVVTDANVEAGSLLLPGGKPRYPILFSLASEAVSDAEVNALRAYVNAGGFLFSGSSSFTRTSGGGARGDFALSSEMGMHISGAPSWYNNQNFTKQQDHRLVAGIPSGSLLWSMISTSSSTGASTFVALTSTIGDAQPIANGLDGSTPVPLLTTKKYGQGQFIYHAAMQPLIGIGGYVSDTYAYLIYRNAIEWAFEQANLPLVKVSPWPYEYDAALTIRKDMENTPYRIQAIEASEQLNDSVGAMGDYYVCTGTLRAGSEDTQLTPQQKSDTIESLRRAIALGATIGSHNGGIGWGGDPNAYGYWHWGPDQNQTIGRESIQISFADIRGWFSGLDNGRVGCGTAGNCPNTWASPNFLSALEGSRQILEDLGSVTMGEQNMGPFPHWSLSYEVPNKLFNHISVPTSEWYIGTSVAQSLEYSYGTNHTIQTLHDAIDFYYNLGALVNIYGHEPTASGVHHEYPVYAAAKPRIWKTNMVGLYDWWALRTPVSISPTYSQLGKLAVAHADVNGETAPETAIEMVLPGYRGGAIDDVLVLINGAPALPAQYRLTSYGVKVKTALGTTDVEVRYTPQLIWEQTDWVGGSGQSTWVDATRYDSADGLDTSIAGQVHLADTGGVFVNSGSLLSSAFDGGTGAQWLSIGWNVSLPDSTGLGVRVRSADSLAALSGATWSSYMTTSGAPISGQTGRWIQYEVVLTTPNTAITPVLSDIHITYIPGPGVNLDQFSPASGASDTTVIVSGYLENDDGVALPPGLPVHFSLDGLAPVSGTTGVDGYVSASMWLNLAPGTYTLTAVFDGTEANTPRSFSRLLEVTAPWPTWSQDTQADFSGNTIPVCLDTATVPGSVRLTGTVVGHAEEPGTYHLGVGEESGPFILGGIADYAYRNRILINNPNADALPVGYTATMTIDTQALASKLLLPNGDDLRIARDIGTGFVELDRLILSGFGTSNTQIAFKLQAGIPAGSRDGSYYLYYGNSGAGSPPANPASVYFIWDDFNGTSIDTTQWDTQGTITVNGGTAALDAGEDIFHKSANIYGLLETRIRAGTASNIVFWGWTEYVLSAPHFLVFQRYPPIRAVMNTTGGSAQIDINPSVGSTVWHDYSIQWNPSQVYWTVDGTQTVSYSGPLPIPSVAMRANIYGYQDSVEVDWIRVRLYASSPPTISLQTPTDFAYRRGVVIQNNAAVELPSGYAVKLPVDTASLAGAGKLLTSGDDLRMVWMNGSTPVELDRVADTPFTTSSTEIWFKTQAAIPPGGSSTDYYIYYGAPSAGTPPGNGANIFPFWDGFDGPAVDSALWNPSGTYNFTNGYIHLNANSHLFSDNSLTYGRMDIRLKAGADNNVMFWGWEETPADASNILVFQEQQSPGYFNAIYRQGGGTWNQPVITDPPTGFTNWNIYSVDWKSNYAQWAINGIESLHVTSSVPSVPLHLIINAYSTIPLDVDWVRVRQPVSVEPTLTLATTHIEYASGSCEMLSVPFDTNQTPSYWKYILWEGSAPSGTSITVQLRTAGSLDELDSADWITYPQAVSAITNPPGRFVQYRTLLNRNGYPLLTPEFGKITLYYSNTPTAVTVSDFHAEPGANEVLLTWQTASEIDITGFNLYRSASPEGGKTKLNPAFIPAEHPGQLTGGSYQFTDPVEPGQSWYYWLEVVGTGELLGPLGPLPTLPFKILLPMLVR